MKQALAILFFLTAHVTHGAEGPFVAADLASAMADPDFAFQGEYQSAEFLAEVKGLQVVALGKGSFRLVVYDGGLPGAGWNRKPPQVIVDEQSDAVEELLAALHLKKVTRQSPTLGAQPPRGATVLFDSTPESLKDHWQPGAKLSPEGFLEQGATSIDTFQDYVAHIEFMTPYMPASRGQQRGNSGIYHQGRYETQVLDSFGLEGKNNETGGIYEIRDPDLNMCFPPLIWQTYDVEFTAPRFAENGEKITSAILTVRLNGVVVQRDVEVPRVTRAAPLQESSDPGPLFIQNHGNPVRFRNIWVLPRNAEQEARRPRIPGFERFHASDSNPSEGGVLFVGELGCVNCHRVDSELQEFIQSKVAPILTEVGKRVRPDWMMQFIANPHASKPGTTMPNLFSGWEESERNAAVLALTNYLSATGTVANQSQNMQAAKKGQQLFREVGCLACHAPLEGPAVATATSVPLANLTEKYSVGSLASFLQNPHAVRPSGRMPSLNLKDQEPEQLAHYLAGGGKSSQLPNVKYRAYHGSWNELPNFAELKPVSTGLCAGLDLTVAGQSGQFAVQYEAYYLAPTAGEYILWLGSDDGSALFLDGKQLVDVDGIHPHSIKEVRVTLAAGVHQVRIDYFEQGGEESLTLDVQPPGGPRQDASLLLTLNENGSPIEELASTDVAGTGELKFHRDSSLIGKGKELFTSLGCVNCHEMKSGGESLQGTPARAFAELRAGHGCLGETFEAAKANPVPDFELSQAQQFSLTSIISGERPERTSANATIQRTMTRFNCYACHERGGIGGPEFERNSLFLTSQHEMGDEGRIPPPLNGVGDKLQDRWLQEVLANGSNDRPYMLTRMPKFGAANTAHLPRHFIELDRVDDAQLATFDEAEHRVKAVGRQLVGDRALACIKCHTFGPHQATGIQAISLTEMNKRVREDWFLRYLYDPARYRPGTRMPTGFPNGQAVIRDLYEGDPHQQISAVWLYLKDGNKAGIPDGLIAAMIELKPEKEPIIYRNFLEGVGPRGIAVGYPELAHLAWDANEFSLKRIWHNRFIDASKHWVGRGSGNQVPLGDHQLSLDRAIPFAQLSSTETPWPVESVRSLSGFQFNGYRLNKDRQPIFQYTTPYAVITEFPKPVPGPSGDAAFERTFTLTSTGAASPVYFRAALGQKIVPHDSGFRIDGSLTIEVQGGGTPFTREIEGHQELLVPVPFFQGTSTIVQKIVW